MILVHKCCFLGGCLAREKSGELLKASKSRRITPKKQWDVMLRCLIMHNINLIISFATSPIYLITILIMKHVGAHSIKAGLDCLMTTWDRWRLVSCANPRVRPSGSIRNFGKWGKHVLISATGSCRTCTQIERLYMWGGKINPMGTERQGGSIVMMDITDS